ncbi:TPA: DUF1496 domain-containing protein [Yersinia enterocolitica]|nr:DUF1496 domain-containing protein [Yersinia enterocolitica]
MKRIILCLTLFISNFTSAEVLQPHDFAATETLPIHDTPIKTITQGTVKSEPQQFLKHVGEYLKGTEQDTFQQERLTSLIEKISINIEIIRDATLRNNEHCLFDDKAYSLGAIHQSMTMACRKDNNGMYYWSK